MLDKYNSGVAVAAAGGNTAVEEFWTAMNSGAYASLSMPSWYMSRFINYMPDLKGKIAVRLMPVMEEGELVSEVPVQQLQISVKMLILQKSFLHFPS